MPKVVAQSESRSTVSVVSKNGNRSDSNTRRRGLHYQDKNDRSINRRDDTVSSFNVRQDASAKQTPVVNKKNQTFHLQFGTQRPNKLCKEKDFGTKKSNIPSSGHSKSSRRDNHFQVSNNIRPYRFDCSTPPYGARIDTDCTLYSSTVSYRECEHNNKKRKRVEAPVNKKPIGRDLPPWLKTGKALSGDKYEMLHQEIKRFVEYISPSPEEHKMRFMVYKCIEQVVHTLWQEAEVHLFGSYDTQLYLPTSDIDMVIFLPDLMYNKKACLYMLAQALEKSGVGTNIRVVAKARVPIIKFQEVVSRFHVDVSFNVENGVQSVPIIKELIQKNSGVRPLVLLLKQFLMLRGLNEVYNGGLGSYSVLLIVVSFLQLHPGISDGQFDPEKDLGRLLVDLFYLYGKKFNYKQDGICVDGSGSYFDKGEKGWANLKEPKLLSIQDPQDPNNDVSKGSFEIMRVKQAFSSAYDSLTSLISSQANCERTKLSPFNASSLNVNEGDRPPENSQTKISSILDIVITISPGALRNRFHVASEYRNLTLQNHLKLQTTQTLQKELEEILDNAWVSSSSIFDKLGPIPPESEFTSRESEGLWGHNVNYHANEDYQSDFYGFYESPPMPVPPFYHFNTYPPYVPNMNVRAPIGIPGANIGNNIHIDLGVGMNTNRGLSMGMNINMFEFAPHSPHFNPMQSFGYGSSFGRSGDLSGTSPVWSRRSYFPRW